MNARTRRSMIPNVIPTPNPTLAPLDKELEELGAFDAVVVASEILGDDDDDAVAEAGLVEVVPVDDGVWVELMMFPARSRNTPLPLAQHPESLSQQKLPSLQTVARGNTPP